jgi:hypothetical protein
LILKPSDRHTPSSTGKEEMSRLAQGEKRSEEKRVGPFFEVPLNYSIRDSLKWKIALYLGMKFCLDEDGWDVEICLTYFLS